MKTPPSLLIRFFAILVAAVFPIALLTGVMAKVVLAVVAWVRELPSDTSLFVDQWFGLVKDLWTGRREKTQD